LLRSAPFYTQNIINLNYQASYLKAHLHWRSLYAKTSAISPSLLALSGLNTGENVLKLVF